MSLRRLITVLLLGCLAALPSYSQDAKARMARLQEEIQAIDQQLSRNASDSRNALGNLSLTRKKLENRKALLAESDRQIRGYDRQISAKVADIRRIQRHIDTLSTYYSRLVRGAYKTRDVRTWYMYILSSDNISQAFRRYSYFRTLSREMNSQAARLIASRDSLEAEKSRLAQLRTESARLRRERQTEVDVIAREERQCSLLVQTLKSDRKKYEKRLKEKNRQMAALEREIRNAMNAAMGNGSTGGKGKGSVSTTKAKPIDYTLSNEFAANKGNLPWPADGPVVERFGQTTHPVFQNIKQPPCKGIGIATSPGASVRAVFDGTVITVFAIGYYGKTIMIQHGEYFTTYTKLKDCMVSSGDKVRTGQVIGTVETIDGSCELHFEFWKGSTAINPQTWLRPQ